MSATKLNLSKVKQRNNVKMQYEQAVQLFNTAAKLHIDAEKLHRKGLHFRGNKCTLVAQTIQRIAAEYMLNSLGLNTEKNKYPDKIRKSIAGF